MDAKHLMQAICNDYEVFLTCDKDTIIKPHGAWIEQRFHIKVMRPSELVAHLGTLHALGYGEIRKKPRRMRAGLRNRRLLMIVSAVRDRCRFRLMIH